MTEGSRAVDAELRVMTHDRSHDGEWNDFVASSRNGTLFHDLTFLDYHPEGRFDLTHLEVRRDGRLVAVIPGGISSSGVYSSPLGASVGGPALGQDVNTADVIAIVRSVQRHAEQQGWAGVEMIVAPAAIHKTPDQSVEFALHHCGFRLDHRWMPLMVPLAEGNAENRYETLFSKGHKSAVKVIRRQSAITVAEGGHELLDEFLPILDDTYRRLDAKPTHSHAEIDTLLHNLPQRVRIWLARSGSQAVAGVLLFALNPIVGTAFYICDLEAQRHLRASSELFAQIIDALGERGFRYLDLGPSATSDRFNTGVVAFKEHLGALPFCRDRYVWAPLPGSE